MAWGWMAASGIGELLLLAVPWINLSTKVFWNNLKRRSEKQNLAQDFIFQQDNDPTNKAKYFVCGLCSTLPIS